MLKKTMTTEELFDKINGILQEKDKLPDILDYGLGAYRPVPIKTYEFDLKSNLAYGGSEGIYLDLWIEYFEDDKKRTSSIGTFKTLHENDEAMHTMAALLVNAEKGAEELWGVDLSQKQLDNAEKLLNDSGYAAKLLCSKLEDELDVPKGYFDYVYSIYGIGWTTDLQGTFDKIASYLKKNGIFIWHHTLNYCVAWSCDERKDVFEDEKLVMMKSYYDESYFKMSVHDSEIILCNRKISTYINALAKAGFVVEQLVEESDNKSLNAVGDVDPKTKKAKMLPISFCIKARKL